MKSLRQERTWCAILETKRISFWLEGAEGPRRLQYRLEKGRDGPVGSLKSPCMSLSRRIVRSLRADLKGAGQGAIGEADSTV